MNHTIVVEATVVGAMAVSGLPEQADMELAQVGLAAIVG